MQESYFDDIRPYNDEEVPSAIERIIGSQKVESLLEFFLSKEEIQYLIKKLSGVNNIKYFQQEIISLIIKGLLDKTVDELIVKSIDNIKKDKGHLLISNHRDIVLDPSFLGYLMYVNNYDTAQIAIGNNLLVEPWITDLVKINKSFIVKRNLQGRELLLASKKLSEYIRYIVSDKQKYVWIAQREGRAKDGNDRTQLSVIKMFNLGYKGNDIVESYKSLNIIPIAISYEYDPCDVLKAKELYLKSKGQQYLKTQQDDLLSMKYGLIGKKGRVCYGFGKVINENIISKGEDLNSITQIIAENIDNQIFKNTMLFPSHYISYDLYYNENKFSDRYTEADKIKFEKIIDEKISLLLHEYKNNDEFRKFIYSQYAQIAKNVENIN